MKKSHLICSRLFVFLLLILVCLPYGCFRKSLGHVAGMQVAVTELFALQTKRVSSLFDFVWFYYILFYVGGWPNFFSRLIPLRI